MKLVVRRRSLQEWYFSSGSGTVPAGGYSEATVPLCDFVTCVTDGNYEAYRLFFCELNKVSPTKDRADA